MTTERNDANIGAFQGQLTRWEEEIFQNFVPDNYKFAAGLLVPIKTYNMPGAEWSGYRIVEYFGEWQLAGNNTTDFPEVQSAWSEIRLPISRFRNGYSYSKDDLEAMAFANSNGGNFPAIDVISHKIEGVRQTYIQTLNRLIAYGNPETGAPGFIGHPSILKHYSPFSIDNTTSSSDILDALHNAVAKIPEYTNEKEKGPFIVLIPRIFYNLLKNRLYTTDNGNSVINRSLYDHFFDANREYIEDIGVCDELAPQRLAKYGFPVEHQYCVQVYKRDPKAVCSCIYRPLTFNEVREKGAEGFYRSAKMNIGEIQYYRPLSAQITYFQPPA